MQIRIKFTVPAKRITMMGASELVGFYPVSGLFQVGVRQYAISLLLYGEIHD